MKVETSRHMLKIRTRRIALHVMPMLSRLSWRRYDFHDSDGAHVESGTCRVGFAQIKWTRTLPDTPTRGES